MEENEKLNVKMTPKEWLDNFWYHYKWHTVAGVIALLTVLILTLQMCSKTSYDSYILYAGDAKISTVSTDGDSTQYQRIVSALRRVGYDQNGDGAIEISFKSLFVLTPDELAQLSSDSTADISLATTDRDTLESTLMAGNYYLCFMSEDIFREKDAVYDGAFFVPLAQYVPDGTEPEYASERGIYLRSLPFAAFIELPEDTVICLRNVNDYSSVFNSRDSEKSFETAKRILVQILTFK